jgi:hypothetical protein
MVYKMKSNPIIREVTDAAPLTSFSGLSYSGDNGSPLVMWWRAFGYGGPAFV